MSDKNIKLMIVIDKSRNEGFKIVDQVSGREVIGVYKCLYKADLYDVARIRLDAWAFNEDGKKFIGNGTSIDYQCRREPKEVIKKGFFCSEGNFMGLSGYEY